jgi:HEAT repeat protein
VQNTLTTIDTVPTRTQIDTAFDGNPQTALASLSAIASDDTSDTGIRLRAIHALAKYCTATPCAQNDVAHQSVLAVVGANSAEMVGSAVLLLRAAIETLGPMGVANDISVLVPLLDHGSRDIRAATARALRDLCNTQAITPLRVRYAKEQIEQVRLAISEALRILDQCSAN